MTSSKAYSILQSDKEFIDCKINCGIENNRKGNLNLELTLPDGRPLGNTKLRIKQIGHEFRFGANLFLLDELETVEKNEKYKESFKNVFNMATLPFYWNSTEPERGHTRYAKSSPRLYRRPPIDLCIEFCENYGIEPREHALAYDAHFPEWIRSLTKDEAKVELERRYREISERYKDLIPTIEVTNEMHWPKGVSALYDEPSYVLDCFKLAEKYFPENKLCINDATHASWLDVCRSSSAYYAYTKAAMLEGARIDAVGMQYHIFEKKDSENYLNLLSPKRLWERMELYATLGKPLHITEVTVPAYSWEKDDEQLQADIIEMLYSLWFAHPAVEQIVYWNLVDGYAHLWDATPERIAASQGDMSLGENVYYGGLLRYDMSEKPAYSIIKELITKRWHTECEPITDECGIAKIRGFYGDYELEVCTEGRTVKKRFTLKKGGSTTVSLVI